MTFFLTFSLDRKANSSLKRFKNHFPLHLPGFLHWRWSGNVKGNRTNKCLTYFGCVNLGLLGWTKKFLFVTVWKRIRTCVKVVFILVMMASKVWPLDSSFKRWTSSIKTRRIRWETSRPETSLRLQRRVTMSHFSGVVCKTKITAFWEQITFG